MPIGSQRQIDSTVAVDVMRCKAHVVELGVRCFINHVRFPSWIFEPKDTLAVYDRHVQSPVCVDIDRAYRVADLQLNGQLLDFDFDGVIRKACNRTSERT